MVLGECCRRDAPVAAWSLDVSCSLKEPGEEERHYVLLEYNPRLRLALVTVCPCIAFVAQNLHVRLPGTAVLRHDSKTGGDTSADTGLPRG